jgi:hypothetical protein
MTEWWTYGLSDFLMFSPQAYGRLLARYNEALWPLQLVGVAASAALVALLRSKRPAATRAALLLLALAWCWVGWAFHFRRYSEIFLAAPGLAAAFGTQALLLAAASALPLRAAEPTRAPRVVGIALAELALLYPLLAPLTGHAWSEAEVFAFLPDPTALASAGALLALVRLPAWSRVLLAVLPLLSLALGAATRWLLA